MSPKTQKLQLQWYKSKVPQMGISNATGSQSVGQGSNAARYYNLKYTLLNAETFKKLRYEENIMDYM